MSNVPFFSLFREYGPPAVRRQERYLDNPFRRHDAFALAFNDALQRQWEDFAHDMHQSVGVVPAQQAADKGGLSDQGLDVALNLNGFNPPEISVKVAGDNLRVEAHHESGTDTGRVVRNYYREFTLPEDVDLDGLKSSLNPNGMLSLRAPRRGVQQQQERAIPIEVQKMALPEKAEGSADASKK